MILNMMTRILKVSGKYKKQIQIAFIFSVLNAVLAKMPILYAMIIISKLYYGTMTSLHAIYVGIVMVITIILQMIFQFRYTIIRKITEKEVLYSRDFWRFSEVLLLILSAGVHSGRSGNFQIKLKRCRHRIWQIQG